MMLWGSEGDSMSKTTTSVPHGSCIPWQMQREDLRYVLVSAGEKGPTLKGWNQVSQGRRHDDPILALHLQHGENYGYYPASGSDIPSLDVDNRGTFHAAGGKDLVRETFRYSAWPDWHKYRAIVSCPEIPVHYLGHRLSIRSDRDQTIVELFFPAGREKTGGQLSGPALFTRMGTGMRYTILMLP